MNGVSAELQDATVGSVVSIIEEYPGHSRRYAWGAVREITEMSLRVFPCLAGPFNRHTGEPLLQCFEGFRLSCESTDVGECQKRAGSPLTFKRLIEAADTQADALQSLISATEHFTLEGVYNQVLPVHDERVHDAWIELMTQMTKTLSHLEFCTRRLSLYRLRKVAAEHADAAGRVRAICMTERVSLALRGEK